MPLSLRSYVKLVLPKARANPRKSGKSTMPDPSKSARGLAGIKIAVPDKLMLSVPFVGSSEMILMIPAKVLSVFGV